MTVTINGSTGITFPAGGTGNPAGTVVGTTDAQVMTNKTIGSGYAGSTVTSGTAVASTSGTSVDFTGIPSWVKRITVMFSGVSTNGTSNYLVQIGDSGGVENTGYSSYCTIVGTTTSAAASTAGFIINVSIGATDVWYGALTLTKVDGNAWVSTSMVNYTGGNRAGSGGKTLSDTLTQVRITTVNGTDTFDAGSINILYE